LLFGAREAGADVYLAEERLWIRTGAAIRRLLPVAELPQRSAPNLLNALAAVACLLPWRVPDESLQEGLRSFRGLPHRHELVAEVDGVRFVDDSKATNVAAVTAGLAGFADPVVLIAGGQGKGEDYSALRDVTAALKAVILIGEEADAIAGALANSVRVEKAPSLAAAVTRAAELARPAGTVLLSPACASFDMFRNYQERGKAFAAAAHALGAR
jgi:UDP-N-acetylmuramoylalanine--D-glutamate ligase